MYQTNIQTLKKSKILAAIIVVLLMLAIIVAGALLGITSDNGQPSAEALSVQTPSGSTYYYGVQSMWNLSNPDMQKGYFSDIGVYTINNSIVSNSLAGGSNGNLYFMSVENTYDLSPSNAMLELQAFASLYKSFYYTNSLGYDLSRGQTGQVCLQAGSMSLLNNKQGISINGNTVSVNIPLYAPTAAPAHADYYENYEDYVFFFVFHQQNGGTSVNPDKYYISNPIVYNDGPGVGLPADPVKEGYTFVGWYYNEALTIPYADGDRIFPSTPLYPKYEVNYYSVKYYIDGVKVFDTSLAYGTELTAPAVTGYNFAGWYRDAVFTLPHNGTITGNVTLYAKYTPKPFSVTVYGYEDVILTQQTKNYNTNFNLATLTVPNVAGHTFAGWYLDSEFQEATNNVFTVYDNIAIYAKYTLNTYTVTVYGLNGTVIMSEQMDYGRIIDTSEGPEIEGYTYVGMYEDQSYTIPFTGTMVTSNITAYAKFTPIMYEYHIFGFGGSALQEGYAAYGTNIDPLLLVAPAVPNRSFLGWYTDAALTTEYNVESLVTGDLSIYAKYSGISYTLTVYGPEGVISTQTFENTLLVDASILTAPEFDGLTFTGWYTNSAYSNAFAVGTTILTNTSIYAKYTGLYYDVTVYGLNDAVLFEDTVSHNSSMHTEDFVPEEYPGYTFFDWYTDPEFKNVFDIGAPITSTLSVYAKYTRNRYTVSAFAGIDAETPFFALEFYYGAQVYQRSLVLTDKPGYTFNGWYSDADLTTPISFPYSVTANISLYPQYTINEYRYNIYGYNGQLLHTGLLNHGSIIPANNFVAPEVDGYIFTGWFRDSSLSTQYSTNATLASPVNVYGKYTLKRCSVTVYGFNGIVTYSGMVDYGATVPAAALHVNNVSGYTFGGYYVVQMGANNVFSANSGIYEDTNVYLNYNRNIYHYQVYGFENIVLSSGDIYYGELIPAVAAPEIEGHAFVDWYTDPSFVSAYSFATPMNANVYIYAKYSAEIYTYAFLDPVDQATVANGSYIYGNTVPLPLERSHTGYTFNGWFLANSETPYDSDEKYAQNIVIEARYNRVTYTCTFTTEYGFSESATVLFGDTLTAVTAPAVDGYEFALWYSDSSFLSPYNFDSAVSSNLTLYGKYLSVETPDEADRVSPWGFIAGGIALIVLLGAGYFFFTKFFKGKRKRAF